ncbi:hypothetical protein EDB86DRAFT_1072731 [Lactarius hatsudake]|nr:hypothetical protein EDB86DRAFT_1072731 [Lactarius hatsudake]
MACCSDHRGTSHCGKSFCTGSKTCISHIPNQIFINLNLNDPWNMMFQNLAFYTMEIFATRMYRSLVNYNMGMYVQPELRHL